MKFFLLETEQDAKALNLAIHIANGGDRPPTDVEHRKDMRDHTWTTQWCEIFRRADEPLWCVVAPEKEIDGLDLSSYKVEEFKPIWMQVKKDVKSRETL